MTRAAETSDAETSVGKTTVAKTGVGKTSVGKTGTGKTGTGKTGTGKAGTGKAGTGTESLGGMNPVLEALALLTPFDIDVAKRRIGPDTDGGYVFADRIAPTQTVLSYGISTEYRFDRIMAEAGHSVYMFDHTIEGIERPHRNMMWFKEGVSGASDPAKSLYSIEDHLALHQIEGDRLILKMDVEGAEFDAIGMISDDTLRRFDQIAIEVHYLNNLENRPFREMFVAMVKKLNSLFTLFHVHANNYDGPNGIDIVGGFPVSNLLELSYIATSTVNRRPSKTLYPTKYDFPNVARKDKLLWFFPFLPTPVAVADFHRCERRIDGLAAREVPRPGPNIALNKPASQSSVSAFSTEEDAQGAVNGRITGRFGFHTDQEDHPWWQVDLLQLTPLQEIIIFNRTDACAARASSLVVKLGDETGSFRQVHSQDGVPFGGKGGDPARIALEGASARYVRIELTTNDYLHLDEVEVYAAVPKAKPRRKRSGETKT